MRFEVEEHSRLANLFDLVAFKTIGSSAQSANWRTVVQRMVDLSGGTSDGVHQESRTLDDDESAKVEERVRTMVQERERRESPAAEGTPQR